VSGEGVLLKRVTLEIVCSIDTGYTTAVAPVRPDRTYRS